MVLERDSGGSRLLEREERSRRPQPSQRGHPHSLQRGCSAEFGELHEQDRGAMHRILFVRFFLSSCIGDTTDVTLCKSVVCNVLMGCTYLLQNHITSYNYDAFFVVRTFKHSSLSHFQVSNTVLLTIIAAPPQVFRTCSSCTGGLVLRTTVPKKLQRRKGV